MFSTPFSTWAPIFPCLHRPEESWFAGTWCMRIHGASSGLPSFRPCCSLPCFLFSFHADDQIVFFIDVNVEVFFCHTGSSQFNFVLFAVSNTLMAGAVAFAFTIQSLSKKSLKILGNQFWFLLTGIIVIVSYCLS